MRQHPRGHVRVTTRASSRLIYQLSGSVNGMRTAIDKAGRLVIPKALRDQAGITAGDVEISLDGAAIRIEGVTSDELVEQDGLLLLPAGGPELNSTRSGSCGLPTKGEHVLVDTSAALALVQRENPFHRAAIGRLLICRRGLSGHAAVELLSVLTRLPSPHRLSPAAALHLEDTNFPESRFLSATDTKRVLKEMAEGGLAGARSTTGSSVRPHVSTSCRLFLATGGPNRRIVCSASSMSCYRRHRVDDLMHDPADCNGRPPTAPRISGFCPRCAN